MINFRRMTKSPTTAEDFYRLGAEAFKDRKFAEAADLFQKATRVDPVFFRAHVYLGMAYHEMGDLDRAVAAYEQALTCEPGYHKAHNNLGNIHKKRGDVEKAIAAFRQAHSLDPRSHLYAYNLGVCLIEAGKAGEAVAPLESARALAPKDPEIAFALGNAFFRARRPEEAIPAYERFLGMAPESDRSDAVRMRVKTLRQEIARLETRMNVRPGSPEPGGKNDPYASSLRWADEIAGADDPIEAALREAEGHTGKPAVRDAGKAPWPKPAEGAPKRKTQRTKRK